MWTRRKLFPTLDVPALPQPAAIATPTFVQQQRSGGSFTLDEDAYNFLASLHYTILPALSPAEATQLLAWALPRSWTANASLGISVTDSSNTNNTNKNDNNTASAAEVHKAVVAKLLQNSAVMQACSQVEYFFFGTDNGQLFQMPLLPPHLLEVLMAEAEGLLPGLALKYRQEAQRAQRIQSAVAPPATTATAAVPLNCVGRRLLHRHMREEPVTAVDHLGVLVASAAPSDDHAVAISLFHPIPAGIVCLAHPCPVRSLKLWEGAAFTAADEAAAAANAVPAGSVREEEKAGEEKKESEVVSVTALRQRWVQHVAAAEPVAVYVFTGDDAGVVRLWRVDVVARTYSLQHVLVCSANMTGMLSPLTPFAREDTSRKVPSRAADRVLHCLDVDVVGHRLFGGTEGGVYVWALDRLPWRGPVDAVVGTENAGATSDKEKETTSTVTTASLTLRHPLCYDEAHGTPLPCALQCWGEIARSLSGCPAPEPTTERASTAVVAYRATRLVNHHVWIAETAAVQAEMARAEQQREENSKSGAEAVSGWKPKYGRVVTGGAAVGVVSNNVRLPDGHANLTTQLTHCVVTVTFDGGELRNDLRLPLSCVQPVVYPAAFLRTPNTACFALRVLAPLRRVLTSCADGRVCVWTRTPGEDAQSAETYQPQLLTENRQEHRGLGRHLCVLRSPDVFVACSFDDGLVKEWHVYDEPELLLRCARRFTLTPYVSQGGGGVGGKNDAKELADMFKNMAQSGRGEEGKKTEGAKGSGDSGDSDDDDAAAAQAGDGGGDVVAGISCATACPAFGALFLVGAFESAIQTYSLTEVVGCEPPRNFIYNGHKTVHLPASMAEDVYHKL